MKPKGGSEIVYENILKYVKNIDNINLILSSCDPRYINPNKPNVLFQELSYDQEQVQLMRDPGFTSLIDRFVFVSNWQYEKFKAIFNVDPSKSAVIRNAIDPIKYKPREKTDKLKLIYTSTPWRGLNVLLKAFELLDRDDLELHVFSSVIIYGDAFAEQTQERYKPLFQKAMDMKNVVYHGYAENEEVRKAVSESHIFSYPCIFEETSCIAAIEAAAAGCKMVCTSFGALPETCADFAEYIPHSTDYRELAKTFSEKLNSIIDRYWEDETQEGLKRQSDHYNHSYGWKVRTREWEEYIDTIPKKAKVNTPEYWDTVYEREVEEKRLWVRKDVIGWRHIGTHIKDGSSVLDFGCGTGDFLIELKNLVDEMKAVGVDYSEYALDQIKKADPDIDTYTALDKLPKEMSECAFDVICALHVLEHFEKPEYIIQDLKPLLKEDGLMVISMPINDQEFIEHPRIWGLPDFIDLLNISDCYYRIWFRDKIVRPKEVTGTEDVILRHPRGTNWNEAVAFIRF